MAALASPGTPTVESRSRVISSLPSGRSRLAGLVSVETDEKKPTRHVAVATRIARSWPFSGTGGLACRCPTTLSAESTTGVDHVTAENFPRGLSTGRGHDALPTLIRASRPRASDHAPRTESGDDVRSEGAGRYSSSEVVGRERPRIESGGAKRFAETKVAETLVETVPLDGRHLQPDLLQPRAQLQRVAAPADGAKSAGVATAADQERLGPFHRQQRLGPSPTAAQRSASASASAAANRGAEWSSIRDAAPASATPASTPTTAAVARAVRC